MEHCSAELTIYVPATGAPEALTELLRGTLPDCGIPFEGAIALACKEGGTITLRHSDAPYGNPYGIAPEDLPPGVDVDHHVATHWDWEATLTWIRSGVRSERPSSSGWPEPLISKEDLDRIVTDHAGDRAALESKLRAFFETPPPTYEIGPRRVVVDWDRSVGEQSA